MSFFERKANRAKLFNFSIFNKQNMSANEKFMSLVTCLRQYTNNIVAAAYIEYVIGTDGGLIMAMSNSNGWQLNRNEFLKQNLPDSVMTRLFTPHFDGVFLDQLAKSNVQNRTLTMMLAEQSLAQQHWEQYIRWVLSNNLITFPLIEDIINIAATNPTHFLRNSLGQCVDYTMQHPVGSNIVSVPTNSYTLPAHVLRAFLNIRPVDIVVDNVAGDGDCFFLSVANQFRELVTDQRTLTTAVLRQQLQNFARDHLTKFVGYVSIWRNAYASDPNSPEWAFFRPYANIRDDRAAAEQMIVDKLFMRRDFYAENMSLFVIVRYLSQLISQKVVLIIIDSVGKPLGLTSDTNHVSTVYTFLYHTSNHYASMMIKGQRLFAKKTLPRLTFSLESQTVTG